MAESLINPLLPLDPSSDGPSRPAARQTYRRARVATPPEDIPSFFAVPTSATTSTSIPAASPAKSLLDRFTTGNSAWRDSLASLDVEHQVEEEVDEDELQLFMRKMKQEKAKTLAATQKKQSTTTTIKSATAATALPVPGPKLGISFSSSSLTDIPQTSTPPSSPPHRNKKLSTTISAPQLQSSPSNDDDETFPVKKSGSSKSAPRRRALAFSDDEMSTPRKTPISSPSPSPRRVPPARHISPPIATASSRTASPDPNAASSRSASPVQQAMTPSSASSSDNEDSAPKPSRADAYLATLFADNQDEAGEDMRRSASKDSSETIKDPAGSFEEKDAKAGSSRKIKPLNQKDQEQLKRDMDRARREREIAFSRPVPKTLPISAFILDATSLLSSSSIKEEVPALVRHRGSSPSTAMHITPPDEITAFTPSSHDKHNRKQVNTYPHRHRSQSPRHQRTSSPVPRRQPRMFEVEKESDEEEEEELSLMDIARQAREEAAKKREADEKREYLAEFKRGALERYRAYAEGRFLPAEEDDDDELEFTVSPVKPKLKLPVPNIPRKVKGPDAKAVLNRDANIVPATTKNRQAVLARAGKSIRSKPASEAVTETYAEYAAKTFKHNELRAANAGSRPAGQKVGRDKALEKAQLDQLLASSHAVQVQAMREKKEQDFGRAKVMPGKKVEDWKELVELSERRTDREEVEEDEDDEDEDFAPEDEESQVDLGSGDEGDVDEDGDKVATDTDEVVAEPEVDEVAKEAGKEDEENVSPIKTRKPRHSARFAITSDDEDETPKKALGSTQLQAIRAPLTEIEVPQPAADAAAFGDDLDLGGFRDDDAGGFSQLFEATQLNGPSAPSDGFAGLRADNVGLLPAHAVLPQNVISDTQVQRDNALIAAEVEEAMEPVQRIQTQPKKQYLKEDGFFTQTKPATQYPTQSITQGRRQLAGSSEVSLMNGLHGEYSPEKEPEATERSPLPPSEAVGSPTQGTQTLRRLRRRDSSDVTPGEVDIEPTQLSPELPPRNAYSLLMDRRRRSPPLNTAPIKSKLVDEQAEESDEDNGWGPTGGNGDDDDEAEDGDAFVEGLVDDQAVDEETKRLQDELAEEKRREVEKLDDAKREEQAKKITEGQYRTKRRGQDFYSDGSEDEDGKPKRWNKRQRKLRRLEGEDGLMKLDGEENVFRKAYEVDLDSDPEDVLVDEPVVMRSPEVLLPYQQRRAMLLQIGQANRKRQEDEVDRLGRHGTLLLDEDEGSDEDEESQFSVTKIRRTTSLLVQDEDSLGSRSTGIRSTQAYQSFVTEESQTNRRSVGITHSSVIVNKVIPSAKPTKGDLKYGSRTSSGQGGSLAGKLLASKTKSFA